MGWFSALCRCHRTDGISVVGITSLSLPGWLLKVAGCGTIRQPSLLIFAMLQYLLISDRIAPDFFEGCFPVRRCSSAVLQAVLPFWAAAHAVGL